MTLSIGCPDSAHQIPSLCSPDSGPVAAAVQGRRSTRGSVSVSRAQPPMCLSCPLVGCGSSIPPEHLRTAPASQAHQVGLVASVHLPEVSERVPELVREQPRNACLDSAFSDQLKDAAISQLPCPTQPHRLNVSLRVERANANVSVNRLTASRPPKRQLSCRRAMQWPLGESRLPVTVSSHAQLTSVVSRLGFEPRTRGLTVPV